MINAKSNSDDGNVEIQFDATRWFEQASDEEIVDLAECGWGGDYPADAVMQFFAADGVTKRLDEYVAEHPARMTNEAVGHETHVDGDSALEWLKANRAGLVDQITAANLAP